MTYIFLIAFGIAIRGLFIKAKPKKPSLKNKDGTINQKEWDRQLKEAMKGVTVEIKTK